MSDFGDDQVLLSVAHMFFLHIFLYFHILPPPLVCSTPTCYVWRQAMSASQSPSLLERATLALRLSPSSDRPSLVSSRNITMSTVKIVVLLVVSYK